MLNSRIVLNKIDSEHKCLFRKLEKDIKLFIQIVSAPRDNIVRIVKYSYRSP